MSISLILASGSPRRKELLERAGITFKIEIPQNPEEVFLEESPYDMVTRLSKNKAVEIFEKCSEQSLILSADTTVIAPDSKQILNKPRDRNEAVEMIRMLNGAVHEVVTGYHLLETSSKEIKKEVSQVVTTKVHFVKLSESEIQSYVDLGESMDKAGAYAAQGLGMVFIKEITGSYTNVIGLPIAEVLSDLKNFGVNYFGK
ncbi:MAG: septum formation protein Maf [Bdellovibrionaceae bacterium]|nr:septum formation protein Maf [Pseudobdellovibrionaceae bacterium]|tara:strand:+ start:2606 stop:3208 length:603 start_codon:yes stop_codon:yes gene_type:complete